MEHRINLAGEREVENPAQEKNLHADEVIFLLSADQVYAQRLVENLHANTAHLHGFIP